MIPQECKYQDKIIEMHGDIKSLITKVDSINGSVSKTIERFEKHEEESTGYRLKIDRMWFVGQMLIVILISGGLLRLVVSNIVKAIGK